METLKTKAVNITPSAIETGVKFDIPLGNLEVIELKSLFYSTDGSLAAGLNQIIFGLYRKSDVLSMAGIMGDEDDIIWNTKLSTQFVTESLKCGWSKMIHFPNQLILIRPPSLIAQQNVITVYHLLVRLYYIIRRVSKDEWTKLLIKDHE